MPPPAGWPPILLSRDYAIDQPPLPPDIAARVRYETGQLRLASEAPDGNQGIAAEQMIFRDVIVQAQLSLALGGDDDLYGLFVRSPSSQLYYTFAVSPVGQVFISTFDGEYFPLVTGPLDPDMRFGYGLGQSNLFQVVAVGPSLTFILNGVIVSGEIVDERFEEGFLGYYVHHGSQSPRAELAADWIQVRGIFPP